MELNEYQEKAKTTCMRQKERRNRKGGLIGSYFPDEIYDFGSQDDKLPLFVEMLKIEVIT